MRNGRKFVAVLLAAMIFAVLPTERAAAFGLGDFGDGIKSVTGTIGGWLQNFFESFADNPGPENGVVLPAEGQVPGGVTDQDGRVDQLGTDKNANGCKNEGEAVDRDAGQSCCAKYQPLPLFKFSDDLENPYEDVGRGRENRAGGICRQADGYVCANCGDGICGKGENHCNCSADCGDANGGVELKKDKDSDCHLNLTNLSCCQGLVCRRLTSDYRSKPRSAELLFCNQDCRPVPELIDAWNSCQTVCLKNGKGEAIGCTEYDNNTVVDGDDGYACCCEKSSCIQEGKPIKDFFEQNCCDGLTQMFVDSDAGFDYICIKEGSRRTGETCGFDGDCQAGLECESFNFEQRTCVDMDNQKEGSACDFDDDCATGFECRNDKCAKALPCADEGQAPDIWNDQECCNGLERIMNYQPQGDSFILPDNAYVCTKCGDGICGKGENKFNCRDCGDGTPVKYETTYFGDVVLDKGECQQIVCVGHSETINDAYWCNGKLLGHVNCAGNESGSFGGTGSGDGVGVERVCCN